MSSKATEAEAEAEAEVHPLVASVLAALGSTPEGLGLLVAPLATCGLPRSDSTARQVAVCQVAARQVAASPTTALDLLTGAVLCGLRTGE
eukprot:1196250-Prorocentrum_minimum.AAC.7